jgi:DNA-binding GntR family transcriptional regulator
MATARASDIAYQKLRDMILDLRLAPGTVVNEQELAAQLELGRMPVHEAVARLAADRFVSVLPRRGTVITSLAIDDVLDMFEAREAIECGVAYIAATRATDGDIARLRQLVEAAEDARQDADHHEFLRDDHEIHSFLIHMVKNQLLQDAAGRLLLHNIRFWRSYWALRPPHPVAMLSHSELIDALEARDPEGAEKAMRQHINASRQVVLSRF